MALAIKNLPVNAEDTGDMGSIPGWEDPLEEGMATHSNILVWRIPWTEDLAVDGSKVRQCRTQLSDLASTYTRTRAYYSHFFKDSFPI